MSLDTLLSAAMAGTHGLAAESPAAPEPWGDVTAPSPERALLLRAGAWAVYAQAGRLADPAVTPVAPAPADRRTPLGPQGIALLRWLLAGGSVSLTAEALRVMAARGLRLPPPLLPEVLPRTEAALREALPAVLDARGAWLAGQRDDWAWARTAAPDDGTWNEAIATARWEAGPWPERVAALAQARQHAPALARGWLADALPKEKPEQRVKLLEAISPTLGPDDAPFLEGCLGDRAAQVRAQAAALLRRLPTSALAAGLATRAEGLLTGTSPATLSLTPPESWPKAWEREGLTEKPPAGLGSRAWWLWQALAQVSPEHWETRLKATPEALIARLETDFWGQPALMGLAQACVTYRCGAWAMPLLASLGRQLETASGELHAFMRSQRSALLTVMPREGLAAMAAELLAAGDPIYARAPLEALVVPWDEALAGAFLEALSRHARQLPAEYVTWRDPWLPLAELSAFKLPTGRAPEVAAIAEALVRREDAVPLAQALGRLAETLTLRQRIHKEITP
jgi:hypothetical protein